MTDTIQRTGLVQRVNESFGRSPLREILMDGDKLVGYDTNYRVGITQMTRSLPQLARVHSLFHSKMVSMGVAVASG